ncbi:shugoshin 2, partial [Anolis sagrei]|uniref:shugoshin 2 n=1 Tax=Anolis sagrei TaxID=38937 RepID=UPI003522599D
KLIIMENETISDASSLHNFGAIKRHVREKRNGAPKVTKLNTSLASKIKTKTINNSSFLKVSLKHNNKALAVALSAAKENSQQLRKEKLLLQGEIDELRLQNVSLRQKLNFLNKTLIEMETFLNNNLLTAIEISTISEHIPKMLELGRDLCNSCQQSEISNHQIRSIRGNISATYTSENDGEKQGCLCVTEVADLTKEMPELSKESATNQVRSLLHFPEKMLKPNETNKMKNVLFAKAFLKENQPSMQQVSSSASVMELNDSTSAGESKANNSPFPINGYVTERKKQNSDTKTKQERTLRCFTDRVRDTNSISNEIDPNGISHGESFPESGNAPACGDQVCSINEQKSEETVYDADMEMTASELGEIVIIKSKAKEKNAQRVNAGKNPANLRKVSYSNTEKHIRDKYNIKPKKINQDTQNNGKIKSIQSIQSKKCVSPKGQWFQRKISQDKMLNNSDYDVGASSKNNKSTLLLNPKSQHQTTSILETEKVEDVISEAVGSTYNQAPEQVSIVSSSEVLSQKCTESNISNEMAGKGPLDVKVEISSITSKINQSKYSEMENGQYLNSEYNKAKECSSDCLTEQDQKTNTKSPSNNNENTSNCCITRERSTHGLSFPKDKINEKLSERDKRKIFAKASRKTYIIYPNSHNQQKISVKQKIQNETILSSNDHMTDEDKQVYFNIQNVTSSSLLKKDEKCAGTFQKQINHSSKPNRKTYVVYPNDEDKNCEKVTSDLIGYTVGLLKLPESLPVLKNPERKQRNYQEKNNCASTQKEDMICEVPFNKKAVSDSEIKPLQELTNMRVKSLPKPKKALEENLTPPIRRRRATVSYKEPSIKSKLRREDEYTAKGFLDFPVNKVKNKPSFKSKLRLS